MVEQTVIELVELASDRKVTADTRIKDLGLDSLEFIQLVNDVEGVFDIAIPQDNYAALETVGDIIAEVKRLKTQ